MKINSTELLHNTSEEKKIHLFTVGAEAAKTQHNNLLGYNCLSVSTFFVENPPHFTHNKNKLQPDPCIWHLSWSNRLEAEFAEASPSENTLDQLTSSNKENTETYKSTFYRGMPHSAAVAI